MTGGAGQLQRETKKRERPRSVLSGRRDVCGPPAQRIHQREKRGGGSNTGQLDTDDRDNGGDAGGRQA